MLRKYKTARHLRILNGEHEERIRELEKEIEELPENPPPIAFTALETDGLTAYIQTPSVTFTRIVFDCYLDPGNPRDFTIFDGRKTVSMCYISPANSGIFSITQDGVPVTAGYSFILDKRMILTASRSTPVTAPLSIFRRELDPIGQYVKGKLYDIKLYNGTILQAHYDMTKGNLQDQTGNGYHAELFNGVWV